jgi:hypothetical protein
MDRLIILFLSLNLCGYSVSQNIINSNEQKSMLYDKTSLDKLNLRICELVKISDCKTESDSIYIYNIFHFKVLRKINKDDLLDSDFTRKMILVPDYQTYPDYINSSAIILDSKKMFIGVSDPNYFYCSIKYSNSNFEMEKFLIKKKDEFKIQLFFDFQDNLFVYVVYGKDISGNIYAFYKNKSEDFKVLPIAEFINLFWETGNVSTL